MPKSVKVFTSSMSGSPALSGTAGTLISVLDACLVNGFGAVTVNSLVVASGVATATVSTGHGFAMLGTTGPVIQISGATPAGLNVEWRVASVTNSTVFTFACPGIADGTASGTISVKRASAGWEKRYSDTNKAAYARLDLAATAMLLRVDDTPAQFPTLMMYESMTDVDTGAGTSLTRWLCKSSAAGGTARPWRLYADGRTFYLFVMSSGDHRSMCAFGDLISLKAADAYHAFMTGHMNNTDQDNGAGLYEIPGLNDMRLARSYTQIGGGIGCRRKTITGQTSFFGHGGGITSYPSLVDNGFHAVPVQIWESDSLFRGYLPGVFSSLHNGLPGDGTIINNVAVGSNEGHTMIHQFIIASANALGCTIDITGPWF